MSKKLRKPVIDPKKYQNFVKSVKSSTGEKIISIDYQSFNYNKSNIPEEAVFSTRDDSVDDIKKDILPEAGENPKEKPAKDKSKNTTNQDTTGSENTKQAHEQAKAQEQKQQSLVDQIKNPKKKGEKDSQLKFKKRKGKLYFYWLIGSEKIPAPKSMGLDYFKKADVTSNKYAGDKEKAIRDYEAKTQKNKKNPDGKEKQIKQ